MSCSSAAAMLVDLGASAGEPSAGGPRGRGRPTRGPGTEPSPPGAGAAGAGGPAPVGRRRRQDVRRPRQPVGDGRRGGEPESDASDVAGHGLTGSDGEGATAAARMGGTDAAEPRSRPGAEPPLRRGRRGLTRPAGSSHGPCHTLRAIGPGSGRRAGRPRAGAARRHLFVMAPGEAPAKPSARTVHRPCAPEPFVPVFASSTQPALPGPCDASRPMRPASTRSGHGRVITPRPERGFDTEPRRRAREKARRRSRLGLAQGLVQPGLRLDSAPIPAQRRPWPPAAPASRASRCRAFTPAHRLSVRAPGRPRRRARRRVRPRPPRALPPRAGLPSRLGRLRLARSPSRKSASGLPGSAAASRPPPRVRACAGASPEGPLGLSAQQAAERLPRLAPSPRRGRSRGRGPAARVLLASETAKGCTRAPPRRRGR